MNYYILGIVVVGLLLVGCVGYIYLENLHTFEINKERTDYNLLVKKYVLPYKLGDDLIPLKPMKT